MLMRTVTRSKVYEALDSERAYQDRKWNEDTTTSGGKHSLEEWLVYIEDYRLEAAHIVTRNSRQVADPQVLEIIRKIGAMCVAAMEQHGAPHRK